MTGKVQGFMVDTIIFELLQQDAAIDSVESLLQFQVYSSTVLFVLNSFSSFFMQD